VLGMLISFGVQVPSRIWSGELAIDRKSTSIKVSGFRSSGHAQKVGELTPRRLALHGAKGSNIKTTGGI
jgi:hypothetical protein